MSGASGGGAAAALGHDAATAPEASVRDYWALLKPRVMSLVIFTALVGMAAAPGAPHPIIAFAGLLCIAVGAGASGALNMWWDADIDRIMERTKSRPIPRGAVTAEEALGFGAVLGATSVVFLGLFANWVAAALLAATILFYIVIYSMWLKRATPLNIVIGGAAGAAPPMIGWAVATGGALSIEPILLFAIIFLWTPPHSWALAMFRNEDYARVGVPMLPVAAGETETRRQLWLYSLGLTAAVLALLATPIAGPAYWLASLWLSVRLLVAAWRLSARTEAEARADRFAAEKKFFGFSILYLLLLFAALLVDAALTGVGVTAASLAALIA